MASLHRQHNKPNWFCAFTDANGKRLFRSTRTSIKLEADEICRLWDKTSREARRKHIPRETLKKAVESTLASILESRGETLLRISVESFFEGWLKETKHQISLSTFNSYSAITKRFLKYLGQSATKDIGDLSLDYFRRYRDELSSKLSTGTVNNHLTMLRLALDSAMERELISKNPAKLVKNLARTDRQARRPFTTDELKQTLAHASPEWRTAIMIGLYTGLRLGDATGLKWEDLDLKAGHYSLKTQKTGRHALNPIAKPLLHHLVEVARTATGPYVCASFWNKETKVLSKLFHELLATAGLVEKKNYQDYQSDGDRRQYGGLSYHCLRHTLTSLLTNTGAPAAVTGDIVGHESEAMTRHYAKIDLETKRLAMDRLPVI